jgi:predicted transcriptional regulator
MGQVKVDLDALVAQGLVEARQRPDGQVGYYPTAKALRLLR